MFGLLKLGSVNKLQAMQHCCSTYLLTERGKHKWYICLRIGFLCLLLVVIVCKLLRYLLRDTSGYMPRGHRVFNKLTPPMGVRNIGSCQPLLCHSFWLLAGRRSGFFIPPNPLPLCLLGFDVDRSIFAYFLEPSPLLGHEKVICCISVVNFILK